MPNDVINTVTIHGTTYGIGGSGGHTIKNPAGTAMTQRSNLQFVDLTISDDSTNDATKVESVHVIHSESELDNLPDGLYMLDEDEDTVIDGNLVGYDNTTSGLNAENVQDAIDEVVETLDDKIDISVKGTANGVAELDENGKVPSAQLPSYVDDVLEYSSTSSFPVTGESGKIYVALETNKTYRWGGTEYVEISESLALGETSSTAYRGDRGKTAYDHSQITSGNPHNVSKSEVGLGNVDNTSDSTKKTNFTGSIASGNTGFTTGGDVYTALGGKADKVSSAINGNLAGLNGSGNLTDSGWNGAKDTTSISGNPISISGLKANQLAVNPIITLEPIQAGSGTPSPSNIRAISGYDKIEVLSCGVNIWDEEWEVGSINNKDGQNNNADTNNIRSKNYNVIEPNKSYYNKVVSGYIWIHYYDANKNWISGTDLPTGGRVFTTPNNSNIKYYRIRTTANYGSKYLGGIGINYPATQTSYVPYHKTTDISESLGQIANAGKWYIRDGKFIITHGKKRMEGNDTFNGSNPGTNAQLTIGAMKPADTTNDPCTVCDTLEKSQGLVTGKTTIFIAGGVSNITYIYNMSLLDPSINSSATLNAYLANHPIEFTYPLLNPIEIQLTPHEISLLKDYAYLSTNGKSISLDYHNGELASLADVSQLGETVNEGLDCLKDYVEKNNMGTSVDLSPYYDTYHQYVFSTDGYVFVSSESATSGIIRAAVRSEDNKNIAAIYMNVTGNYQIQSLFVRKGMSVFIQNNTATNSIVRFNPLV